MQTICKERQYSKVHEEEWSVEKEPVSLENIDSHVVPASWAWIYVLSIANFGISAAWSL